MSTRPSGHLAYRPEIDGLRAIAVLSVIFYHAFPKALPGGFVGVDIFFVISGFLISSILLKDLDNDAFSFLTFYGRRVRRLLPALLVVLSTCALVGYLTLYPQELQALGKELMYAAGFISNFSHLNETGGYFGNHAETEPLLHLWSLGVEEQFYLVWPVVLLIAYRWAKPAIPWLLLLGVLGSAFLSAYLSPRYPANAFYVPHTRMWELGIGALLAVYEYHRGAGYVIRAIAPNPASESSLRSVALQVQLLGLLAIFVSLGWLSSTFAIPGLWVAPALIGSALCIAAGSYSAINRRVLSHNVVRWFGKISYPLYLWHWPVLVFIRLNHSGVPSTVLLLIGLGLSVLLAALTYHGVERHTRHIYERSPKLLMLVAGLFVLGVLGFVFSKAYVPSRLASAKLTILETATHNWKYPGANNFQRSGGFTSIETSPNPVKPGVVLFLGDSHMEQYWPRVEEVTRTNPQAHQARFVTHAGCPPLPGLNRTEHLYHCSAFSKWAFAQAEAPDVTTVVLGGYWETYFMGGYGTTRPSATVYATGDPNRSELTWDSPATAQAFMDLQTEIQALRSHGKQVYLVLSGPSSETFDPLYRAPDRLAVTPRTKPALAADISRAAFEAFIAPVDERLRAIAAWTGARVIDPVKGLCGETLCPASAPSGEPYYRDSHHLTATASIRLGSYIDETLLSP